MKKITKVKKVSKGRATEVLRDFKDSKLGQAMEALHKADIVVGKVTMDRKAAKAFNAATPELLKHIRKNVLNKTAQQFMDSWKAKAGEEEELRKQKRELARNLTVKEYVVLRYYQEKAINGAAARVSGFDFEVDYGKVRRALKRKGLITWQGRRGEILSTEKGYEVRALARKLFIGDEL